MHWWILMTRPTLAPSPPQMPPKSDRRVGEWQEVHDYSAILQAYCVARSTTHDGVQASIPDYDPTGLVVDEDRS